MSLLVFQSYIFGVALRLLLIFGLYWISVKVVLLFVKNLKWHDYLEFYAPVVRNVLIFLFSIELIVDLGVPSPFLTIGVVTGLVIVFWSYVKEFCLGTIFKIQRGKIDGQRIKIKEFAGLILKMNNTKLEIETEKGEIVQIPYSFIVSDVEIKPTSAKYLRSCVLVMQIKALEFDVFEEKVYKFVATLPYVVGSVKPKIEVVSQNKETIECKLVVFTNNEKFIPSIKSKILNYYS